MNETTILVAGMTCGACVNGVTMALGRIDGVDKVEVDLPSGRVRVRHVGPVPSAERLRRALDDAGYEFGGVA